MGTINFDYRSFYLNFECAALIYKCGAVEEIKKDFLATLELSEEITQEKCRPSAVKSVFQAIFRLFAPLM